MFSGFLDFIRDNHTELLEQIYEHLWLTMISVMLATITGISLGVLITRKKHLARPVIGLANAVQTIPSIALLGVLLPLVGIGPVPAIIALFLYGLLPVIRNTYTGIIGVDPAVMEAARGMGLSETQQLTKVELPLATPVIFAGIRTAFVINVGVATLCALIAAGGLGEFIFRGLSTNNPRMILAGAIPAAAIALIFDALLGYFEKNIRKYLWPVIITFLVLLAFLFISRQGWISSDRQGLSGGFPSEFIQREDGFPGLDSTYDLNLEIREMEIGLMYDAVRNGEVDVISGFSTDGRIAAFNLTVLEDDKRYFPPYHAAPLIRSETLRQYPEIEIALEQLSNLIPDTAMARLNFLVDQENRNIREVARQFLASRGLRAKEERNGSPDILIGSKNFTENYILAEMFAILIENYTSLDADTKLGFGGTKLIFDALNTGEIDMYPEYTGTGLLVILQTRSEILRKLKFEKEAVYNFVSKEFLDQYQLRWLGPFGFNNTFALMTRSSFAKENRLKTISDLAELSRE